MNKEEKKRAVILRPTQTESLVPDAQNMMMIAKTLLTSGMWAKQFKNEAEIFAAAEMGRELGLGPVMSLNSIFPVNGKLGMMTNVMLAVATQRAGVSWEVESMTQKGCVIIFSRPGFKPLKATFDETDARAAGLIGKDNWKAYPTDMYFIRAAARGIRKIAPDAITGLYSVEELRDLEPDIMPKPGEIREVMPANEPETEKKKEPEKKTLTEPKAEPKTTAKPTPGPKPGTKTKATEQGGEAITPIKDDKERVIENINAMLVEKTFDPKHFKIFLYDFQKNYPNRKFVDRNQFKNLSFHEGNLNDLRLAVVNFAWLADKYLEWAKLYQPKAKEPLDEKDQEEEGVGNAGPEEDDVL